MSSEGQMQDPEIPPAEAPSSEPQLHPGQVAAVEIFDQRQHRARIGEELRALLTLAIPVVLSELGWMTMTIVDLIMVGRLGPDAIGAVGLGNAIYYAPSLFGIGLLLGLDTLVSQSWGAGRFDDCHRSLAQAIYIALAFTPLLMLFMLAAQWIFTGRGVDPTVASLTRSYVGILNWGTFPLLVYGGFRRYLQGVGQVRPVAFALITANLVNLAFNWILIYGHFGFPALGVRGSGSTPPRPTSRSAATPSSLTGPRRTGPASVPSSNSACPPHPRSSSKSLHSGRSPSWPRT
jgi:Na+-driven multidrug efflux pump